MNAIPKTSASLLLSVILLFTILVTSAHTRPHTTVKNTLTRVENPNHKKSSLILPYGFSSDSMGLTLGVGGMMKGYGQDQLLLGATTLLLRQFNRYRSFKTDEGDIDATTHPVEFALSYTNTDFPTNPATGSSQYLSLTHDFGWLESPDDWTFVEFEASNFYSLSQSDYARQRVIALNFWTGDTPSWEESLTTDNTIDMTHRPPFYEGATLGGFYRMRAYPKDRFNDRSVIYGTAEYRDTLHWNPLGQVSWLNFLQSDWLQLVAFAEGGRVANDYDTSELFTDWKFDAGAGIRCQFAGAVA